MSPTRWAEIQVRVSPEAAEGVSDQMQTWASGVAETTSNGLVTLTCYLPADDHLGTRADAITQRLHALRALGLEVGEGELTIRPVDAEEWAEAWKAHFQPLHVAGHLFISPSWSEECALPGEVTIILDPGMAFGTGSHATTHGCLEMICHLIRTGDRVADVGTGSGILAIAAAQLGAAKVVAVDNDPIAVATAQENARINEVTDRVRVLEGDLLANVSGQFDLIVANLVAEGVVRLAPALAGALKPDGHFVGSGIVELKLNLVEDALSKAGLQVAEVAREGEWITVKAECRAS